VPSAHGGTVEDRTDTLLKVLRGFPPSRPGCRTRTSRSRLSLPGSKPPKPPQLTEPEFRLESEYATHRLVAIEGRLPNLGI